MQTLVSLKFDALNFHWWVDVNEIKPVKKFSHIFKGTVHQYLPPPHVSFADCDGLKIDFYLYEVLL